MKLLLTSTGLSETTGKDFLDLLGRDPKGLRVAFVPTAMRGESEESAKKWIPIGVEDLEKYGMHVELVELEKLNEENVVQAFALFDVIYVFGGNTFYLMQYASTSGFAGHIREIIGDKIYIGVSAGSVIAGPDIALANWGKHGDRNAVGLQDLRGLAIVPFTILPHWKGNQFKEADGYPFEVRYIKDGEGVVINS